MVCGTIALYLLSAVAVGSAYVTYYADEECNVVFGKEFAHFYLDRTTYSSSALILKATRIAPYPQGKNCTMNLIANYAKGVILSIRRVDLSYLPTYCSDYIEIYDDSIFGPIKRCGYFSDMNELQTYTSSSNVMSVLFHSGPMNFLSSDSGFELIATAYTTTPCLSEEFRCSNSRCVWNGLKCDGHNNCGDNSDERISLCDDYSSSPGNYILIICFGVIVAVVILTSSALFCIRMKRWRSPSMTPQGFRPEAPLPPYHTVYPSGYSISQNPAGPTAGHVQGDGGISNPCYSSGYPEAPPPYKP